MDKVKGTVKGLRRLKTPGRQEEKGFIPFEIEITIDGKGDVFFASSAPIFDKKRKPQSTLCG